MPDPKKDALSSYFSAMRSALKLDFYKRLLQGDIEGAKRTARFVGDALIQLQARVADETDIFRAVDEEKTQTLVQLWSSLMAKYPAWKALVDHELAGVARAEFQKEPQTYKALLQGAFRKPVLDLVDILAALERFAKSLEKGASTASKVPAEYAQAYARVRERADPSLQERLDKTEQKVRLFLAQKPALLFQKKVTDRVKVGPWAGYLHAWVGAPFDDYRVIYAWDAKKITFAAFGRHKELGLGEK